MTIIFSNKFRKKYRKLSAGEKGRVSERLRLFEKEPFHPVLFNHQLQGEFLGYRSINIGGDLRAVFYSPQPGIYAFADLGTHHELYGS